MPELASEVHAQINETVEFFKGEADRFAAEANNLQGRLLAVAALRKLIHSVKWRTKDPEHLRDKLRRRAAQAVVEGRPFDINKDNLLDRIHDLAGVRLLHLHMSQMKEIHPLIVRVLKEEGFVQAEKPEAKTWDLEYERMFKELRIKVKRDESLYTSVHYVIKQNSRNKRVCELQVRTVAEEIWGEISHVINYPHPTDSVACREQLKVLARVVSGCSRLVDSIVASHEDHVAHKQAAPPAPAARA